MILCCFTSNLNPLQIEVEKTPFLENEFFQTPQVAKCILLPK